MMIIFLSRFLDSDTRVHSLVFTITWTVIHIIANLLLLYLHLADKSLYTESLFPQLPFRFTFHSLLLKEKPDKILKESHNFRCKRSNILRSSNHKPEYNR
ncbi:hypothetical protein TNIN_294261 [Trichonephila inaurata madagascariensis]|uniref:Uncharacterized protein n=1 Tax=Trichonephila inaurata madagascariensis TaxID=2747483 RepID=A0A8X6I8Q7_9ARAC|nr:hypothetical protein TNIN_294261 [Trichonephila inaurata madagascariensis]